MLQGFGFSLDLGNMLNDTTNVPNDNAEELEDEDEATVLKKSQDKSEFDVQLLARPHTFELLPRIQLLIIQTSRIWLPVSPSCPCKTHQTAQLSTHVCSIPLQNLSPNKQTAPSLLKECHTFEDVIKVYHCVTTTFYVPSDLSRSGGLWCEFI